MTYARHLALIPAVLLAVACGSSSSSPGTAAGPRLARGAITAASAGSITVNGVQLSTAGAAIRVDDNPGVEGDLKPGMVVTVKGTFDDRLGGAAEIEFDDNVRGRVVLGGAGIVTVGGVEVHVDPNTIGTAAGGARVRVSGVPDDKGGLRATRIDDSPGPDDLEVKGFVSALDTAAKTFQLRLTPDATTDFYNVSYGAISLPAGVANGSYVEVRSATPVAGFGGTIAATSMQLEDRFLGEDEVEIEGIVSSGGPGEFVVDGLTVRTGGATRWESGAPTDLVPGVKVEAEGRLSGGVLQADKVSYRDVVRITAPVTAAGSGTLTVLGLDVVLSTFVDFDPALGGSLVGKTAQIRGYPTADGKVVALRVDDRTGENRVTLQGIPTSKSNANPSAPSFVIMGITVTTSGSEFRDISDNAISAQQLYGAVEVGRTVLKVRTQSNPPPGDVVVNPPSSTLAAKQVELEGQD
jgi:hypothetical protein